MKPLFTIYDSVAGFYSPCFLAENEAHATRMFKQSIDLDHKHDFALFVIGAFDPDDGTIHEKTPAIVIHGNNLEGTPKP